MINRFIRSLFIQDCWVNKMQIASVYQYIASPQNNGTLRFTWFIEKVLPCIHRNLYNSSSVFYWLWLGREKNVLVWPGTAISWWSLVELKPIFLTYQFIQSAALIPSPIGIVQPESLEYNNWTWFSFFKWVPILLQITPLVCVNHH